MNMDSPEISNKIKSAIKAKLVELESYVDDELPGKVSFTLAAAVCGFCSGLRQCRDRNFSISAEQCNCLPQTHAENAVMSMSL